MYLLLKAIHVFAVATLIGGLMTMAMVLRNAAPGAPMTEDFRRIATAVLRWDTLVTVPALAGVWVVGMTMAFGAGWGDAPWLLAKLGPAALLSGLHGLEGFALRRMLLEDRPAHPLFAAAPAAILLLLAVICWLAVTKPF